VSQLLTKLRARCKKGKLIDGNGREIYFLRMIGCWGNPPANYQKLLEKQRNELTRLKRKYTVIEALPKKWCSRKRQANTGSAGALARIACAARSISSF